LNGQTYQVGTISQDGFAAPQALVLKLIKPSITQVKLAGKYPAPLWQNMMKNVYSLGAFGIAPENFDSMFGTIILQPASIKTTFQDNLLDGKILLQVLNLDRIDAQQMPYPDGFFDFIPNASTVGV
jgi:cell surface protein SprA